LDKYAWKLVRKPFSIDADSLPDALQEYFMKIKCNLKKIYNVETVNLEVFEVK
jgi:hypothetical protein